MAPATHRFWSLTLLQRVATGLVLAPLLVWLLLAGPLPLIVVVIGVAGALCAHELLGMWPVVTPRDRWMGTLLTALVVVSPWLLDHGPRLMMILSPVLILIWCLRQPDDLPAASRRAMVLLLTVAYVGGLASAMTEIAAFPDLPTATAPALGRFRFGPAALLSLMAIVFAGDTGAYFAGRFLGRHKLYPLVSPKKTIEGSIGGLAASIGVAYLASLWLIPQLGTVEALSLGAICGMVAQIGDLAESMFKRASGTKDSGTLLPGHGGMLDRLDGVLFAAPIFLAWLLVRS
ncbi:MAG: phosphatidate cytidylyltransferase [Myxococcales bacterium]|nr:phosphatidate cytidylyltransferase [Myxococcales bacterium]